MNFRSFVGLSVLAAACVATVPAFGTVTDQRIFDAVNAYDNTPNLPGGVRGFAVTGVLRGQAQEQTQTFQFLNTSYADTYGPSCERLALLALRDAGHYAFVVELENTIVLGCRIERR